MGSEPARRKPGSFVVEALRYTRSVPLFPMRRSLALLSFAVLLASCKPQATPLPQGEQTLNGELKPIEFSVVRRGTHLLLEDGKPSYYVESPSVNLFDHEGVPVTLVGTLQPNTDPALPAVLVVSRLTDTNDDLVEKKLPGLDVAISVPSAWRLSTQDGAAAFFTEESAVAALTVTRQQVGSLPFSWRNVPFKRDVVELFPDPILGKQVIVYRDAKRNLQTLYVEDSADATRIYAFAFSREVLGDAAEIDELIRKIAESIKRSSAVQSGSGVTASGAAASVQPRMGTGGKLGSPCGGTAGILCPDGSYCNITDTTNNVGRCEKL